MVKTTVGKKPLQGTQEMREFMTKVATLKKRRSRMPGGAVVGENIDVTSESKVGVRRSRRSKTTKNDGAFDASLEADEVGKARRRLRMNKRDFDVLTHEEERMIAQAVKNSLIETKKVEFIPPEAPVYYPTFDEFKNPLEYISRYLIRLFVAW